MSRLWLLARKLSGVLRTYPAQAGAPLHIGVLADPLLRYSAAQAIGLRQAGANVTLYYVDHLHQFDGDERDRARVLREVEAHAVDVVKLGPRRLTKILTQTYFFLRELRARRITGLIAQAHFDPRYALASLRLPTLLVLHDPRPHSGDSSNPPWPAPLVARFAEGTASCLMIHSERLIQQIRPSLRAIPRIIIPHGATIAPAPVRRPHSRVVLVAGRLFAYKGVDAALAAFPAVRDAIPEAELIVAGRGPMAAEARRRNLAGVRVKDGYVSEVELEKLLDAASVVLLPYRDATQSGIGLLAVGRGIPCVVSERGALPDILGPLGDDLVWSTPDLTSLTRAIVTGLNMDDSFRAAVYDRAAALFAWDVVGARLISALSQHEFGVAPTPRMSGD